MQCNLHEVFAFEHLSSPAGEKYAVREKAVAKESKQHGNPAT
jgi:hypothetical protein